MTRRLALALLATCLCQAELHHVDTLKTEPFGDTHELITAKAHFTLDPRLRANKAVVDLALAPRNAQGLVEASADLVLIQPRDPARANGTTLFEVSNRGGYSALTAFNGSRSGRMEPGSGHLLKQGYTIAWLGWQFGLPSTATFRIDVPKAQVQGTERWYSFGKAAPTLPLNQPGGYCAAPGAQATARLYTRASLKAPRQLVPNTQWDFPDPCTLRIEGGFQAATLYELIYPALDPPVAGIGLAAVRDLISWMKLKNPQRARRAIGYGYSQSARFLRQFLYDGVNADEKGRIVFDGLLLAAGGAGRGSFNHRFAEPNIAGNSTEGFDEPVDIFPFSDLDQTDPVLRRTDGLLQRAAQQRVIPKIFHLSTSTEYWARAASLLHTSVDGTKDLPLAPTSRIYYFPGTPHSPAAVPPTRQTRAAQFEHHLNPFGMITAFPALLTAMNTWIASNTEPPPSRYPTLAKGDLVPPAKLTPVASLKWPDFVPEVTRLDFGPEFPRTGIITKQPPERGAPYPLLVPQVSADGNEIAGVRLPHVVAPLAVVTGWNQWQPSMNHFGKLAGLAGAYIPFAQPAIQQRYANKDAYLANIRSAAEALVKDRFLHAEAIPAIVDRAAREWDWIAAAGAR
ncbi:MAG TPA: alpha/beta hydrolase domain-containing protein [Bryobacteraceae bacterium]|nr:alpha/beta hydrolase domain-containing protein [Bryobacteraceae bacterium]